MKLTILIGTPLLNQTIPRRLPITIGTAGKHVRLHARGRIQKGPSARDILKWDSGDSK